MASIYDLKPGFQATLRPLCGWLARAGVSPNAVTVAAAVLSATAGGAVALVPHRSWPLLLVPPVLLARMALNAIDGMLAREHDMRTRLGGYLNELGDVVSDAALYLPLALVPGVSAPLVVVAVCLSGLTETTGVLAAAEGASRRYEGPMGKSDRALALGLLCLLLGAGVAPGAWTELYLAAVVCLLALTVVLRARAGLAEAA